MQSSRAILVMEFFIAAIVVLSIAFFAFGGFYLTVLRPDYAPVAISIDAMQDLGDRLALEAEQQFAGIEKTGSSAEICRAATGVAEDYHHANQVERYAEWTAIARQRCQAPTSR
jgi:hypothetical protein